MILGLALSPGIRQLSRDRKNNHRELRVSGDGIGSELRLASDQKLHITSVLLSLDDQQCYFDDCDRVEEVVVIRM